MVDSVLHCLVCGTLHSSSGRSIFSGRVDVLFSFAETEAAHPDVDWDGAGDHIDRLKQGIEYAVEAGFVDCRGPLVGARADGDMERSAAPSTRRPGRCPSGSAAVQL
jgi:hypothetical protein